MLPNLWEKHCPLIPKPDKQTTRKKERKKGRKEGRKWQPSIPDEIDAKILNKILAIWTWQYIKRITQHDQVGFIPGMQGCFNVHNKSINIKKTKDQNHMIISIGTERAFDKIQQTLMIKTLNKVGREWTHFIIKARYENKIFSNDMFNKGSISKIYKEVIQFNIKKANNQIKNGQKTWIDIFPKKTNTWATGPWEDAQHR